ncbi:MAG: fibronectin type III domain-containing protein [Adlercreutzia sp.]|nr:fibronectin type III domain-containing protein [Adlercreutzia sp.]
MAAESGERPPQGPGASISGGGDEEAPALTSISVSPSTVSKPGVAKLTLGIQEDGTGVGVFTVIMSSKSGKSSISYCYEEIVPDYQGPLYTGTHTLSVPVGSDAHNGDWYVSFIQLYDQAGNTRCYYADGGYDAQVFSAGDGAPELPVARFKVKDEFDYHFAAALSNPQLVAKLKSMPEGTAAKVKIDSNKTLPKAAFDAIRGKNKTIVCYDGAIQWIFNGRDVTKSSKDIKLNIEIATIKGTDLDVNEKLVQVTFAKNGELPGKAQIRFKSDYLYTFQGVEGTLRLYYKEGGELTQEKSSFDLVFDGTDKWCYMDVTHNSEFIVSPVALKSIKMKNAKITGVKADYKYTGRSIKPTVRVSIAGKTLTKNKDYTVKYKANKKIGKGYIILTGKGEYKKAGTKKIAFNINPVGTKLSKPKAAKKSFTVAWKKQAKQTTGYQIQYSTDKKFKKKVKTKTVKSSKKTSLKITKLKKKTKYYVRVRTYKKVGKSNYYSTWSSVKSVKTK